MSHKARESLITGIVIYLVDAFLYYNTMNLPSAASLFPRACLILLAFLNTLMIIVDLKKYSKGDEKGALTWDTLKLPLLAFVGIFIYVFLFDKIGYFPATVIMMVGFMLAAKVKPWWKMLLVIAFYCLFIYLLFVLWLQVRII